MSRVAVCTITICHFVCAYLAILEQSLCIFSAFTGAPSSPVPVLTFDRPGEVTLEWNTPFSWPQYPVHSYDVMVPNHSRENINETRVKFSAGEDQHNCEPITFKVRATSELGKSEYGSVIAGFPIGKCTYMYNRVTVSVANKLQL